MAMSLELERIEALDLLGMVQGHLNWALADGELSPRVATLMRVRDKLVAVLQEEER